MYTIKIIIKKIFFFLKKNEALNENKKKNPTSTPSDDEEKKENKKIIQEFTTFEKNYKKDIPHYQTLIKKNENILSNLFMKKK